MGHPLTGLRATTSPSLTAHTCRYLTPAGPCSDHRYVLKLSLEHIILGNTICLTQTIATMRVADVCNVHFKPCVCSLQGTEAQTESGLSGALSCISLAWVHQCHLEVCSICRAGKALASAVSSQVLVGRGSQ